MMAQVHANTKVELVAAWFETGILVSPVSLSLSPHLFRCSLTSTNGCTAYARAYTPPKKGNAIRGCKESEAAVAEIRNSATTSGYRPHVRTLERSACILTETWWTLPSGAAAWPPQLGGLPPVDGLTCTILDDVTPQQPTICNQQ